jgi:hypothetical protein
MPLLTLTPEAYSSGGLSAKRSTKEFAFDSPGGAGAAGVGGVGGVGFRRLTKED